MTGVKQDERWHKEGDVLTHSLLAADAAAEICHQLGLPEDRREYLVLAALFHDIGKPATTRSESERLVSPGHAEVGERLILQMGGRLGWSSKLTCTVAGLTRHHMAHVSVAGDPSRRAVTRLQARLRSLGSSLEDWSIVVQADGTARGTVATTNRAEPWTRVAAQLGIAGH